jgi:sugar O-acyltransferase (sialic acid O-acetyltransferase NeuD family)
MNKILLVGAGGHCRSCIDVIEEHGAFEIFGVVEPAGAGMGPVLGYPCEGTDDDLASLREKIPNALVTVGQIKSAAIRIRLFDLLCKLNYSLPVIVSPFAHCSKHSAFGQGTIVMHGACVNAGAVIGENCIVNSQALIEHDVYLSGHCHISTGAKINGEAKIGRGVFIGSGAIIREGISVGDDVVVPAGTFVSRDIP